MFLTNSFFKGNLFHSGNGCNHGISLIALIITIIVIIILAAISIAGVSGVVERSRYAKFCGDLDAVQEAVSQAYGKKQIDESQNPNSMKNSEAIYKWIATGKDATEPETVNGPGEKKLYKLADDSVLGLDLPKYGDSDWGLDPKTGEVYLVKGFEYDDSIYYCKADIQNGGSKEEGGSNTPTPPSLDETPVDTKSKVGFYVDFDGVDGVDGVIFADLAVGGSGKWENDEDGTFEISTESEENLKKYYIKEKNKVDERFGTTPRDVLAEVSTGNEGKKDRFYVMALENIDSNFNYWWYYYGDKIGIEIEDWDTKTSTQFGGGKTNTTNMMDEYWEKNEVNGKYETVKEIPGVSPRPAYYDKDMWYVIKDKVNEGWFSPSIAEWCAFLCNLGITSKNFTEYGLSSTRSYCSSSLSDTRTVWNVDFDDTDYLRDNVTLASAFYVRLATTF